MDFSFISDERFLGLDDATKRTVFNDLVGQQAEQDERFAKLDPATKRGVLDDLYSTHAAEKESPGFWGTAKDLALKGVRGVVDVGEGVVGLADVATGNLVGKGLAKIGYDPAGAKQVLTEGMSEAQRTDDEQVEKADGFWETMSALVDNPRAAFGAIAESAPMTIGGMAAARAFATRMLASAGITAGSAEATAFFAQPKVQAAIVAAGAAAEGAQTTGSIQEQGRQAGREWGETVLPAIGAGATTAGIGILTSKIPGLRDAEATVATTGLGGKTGKNLLESGKEIAKAMFKEGWLEELPQSAQEQVFTNLAMGKQWDEGVGSAAAQGAVAGMAQGGGMVTGSEIAGRLLGGIDNKGGKAPTINKDAVLSKIAASPISGEELASIKERLAPHGITPEEIDSAVEKGETNRFEQESLRYRQEQFAKLNQARTVDEAIAAAQESVVSDAELLSRKNAEMDRLLGEYTPEAPVRFADRIMGEWDQSAVALQADADMRPLRRPALPPPAGVAYGPGFEMRNPKGMETIIRRQGEDPGSDYVVGVEQSPKVVVSKKFKSKDMAVRSLEQRQRSGKLVGQYDIFPFEGGWRIESGEGEVANLKQAQAKQAEISDIARANPIYEAIQEAEESRAAAREEQDLSYVDGLLEQGFEPSVGVVAGDLKNGDKVVMSSGGRSVVFTHIGHDEKGNAVFRGDNGVDHVVDVFSALPAAFVKTGKGILAKDDVRPVERTQEAPAPHNDPVAWIDSFVAGLSAEEKALVAPALSVIRKQQVWLNADGTTKPMYVINVLNGVLARAKRVADDVARRSAALDIQREKTDNIQQEAVYGIADETQQVDGPETGNSARGSGGTAGNLAVEGRSEDGGHASQTAQPTQEVANTLAPPIKPDEKINGVTRRTFGQIIAEGNVEEAVKHVREGLADHGPLKMQDAVRNEIMRQIALVPKPKRDGFRAKIKPVEDALNALLNPDAATATGVAPERQKKKGALLLWDGSEPASAVTGQRPAYAGNPESGSGQDTPTARGQSSAPDRNIPTHPAEVKIETLGSGIIVKGDRDAIRARLAEAGVEAKGLPNTKRGGLFFAKKHEAAVRVAMAADNISKSAEFETKPTERLAGEKKEPWQMTREEFAPGVAFDTASRATAAAHRRVIEQAISEGKPVPTEVLAEYPDLQADRSVDEATLEDVGLLREYRGRWQYKFSPGANWMTSNDKGGAVEQAIEAYHRLAPEDRLTAEERAAKANQEWRARMDHSYGRLTKDEIEQRLAKIGADIRTLQKGGEREFNGMGGRRTGAATSAEAARVAGEEKLNLTRYYREKFGEADGQSSAETVTATPEAARPTPQLESDIPNEKWLQEERDYTASKGKDRFGVYRSMGKVTGRFDGPVLVPVSVLAELKGERGEQDNVREDTLRGIMEVMERTGKLPTADNGQEYAPYVEVDQDGTPWVSEGNHRIMSAAKLGWDVLPTEIKYFNGGEREPGPLHPDKVMGWATATTKLPDVDSSAPIKPASEMTASELLRAAADKMDAEKKAVAEDKAPTAGSESNKSTLAAHDDFMERLYDGKVTLDEYRAAFERVKNGEEEIKAELSAMTKQQILDRMGGMRAYRYKNDKKDAVVRSAMYDLAGDFVLSGGYTSYMGESVWDAVGRVVEKTTEADLKAYAEDIKSAQEARKASIEQAAEAMKDPKTLDDFKVYFGFKRQDGVSFKDAYRELTPEQQAAYDSFAGETTRSNRKAKADQQKTEVRVAAHTTTGDIIETKHTKTGEDLFVVRAAERVERDVYNQWNTTAKRLGGHYSSYRGGGAAPGFQFKTKENAEAFLAYLGGEVEQAKEAVQARRDAFADDRSQSAVERLREMAEKLDGRADEKLSAPRLANTERRARMASTAESAANYDKALAATMRNIAQAIEDGRAKFLDRVRQKVQVEALQTFLRRAQSDELRAKYPQYIDQEKYRGEPATGETVAYVEFPQYTAYRSDLARLGRELSEQEGTKKLGLGILKVADDVTGAYLKFAKENHFKVATFAKKDGSLASFKSKADAEVSIARSGLKGRAIVLPFKRGENLIIQSPTFARENGIWKGDDDKRITISPDVGAEIVAKVRAMPLNKRVSMPWVFDNVHDELGRLKGMGIETPAELRAALREFLDAREAPKAPDKVKDLERKMIGRRRDGLDFFPTPEGAAQDMIEAADIQEGMAVLEPSAGMGHIAEQIREAGVEPDVVELSGDRRELLEAKGFNVVGHDFMEVSGEYDRIVMNPPFSDRRDAEHVQHAYTLLKPGGRMVAIMGEGVFFGQDKKAQAFREWLDSVGGTSEKLDEGTFLDPSLPINTGVNARMVVIDKPTKQEAFKARVEEKWAEKEADVLYSQGSPTGTTKAKVETELRSFLGRGYDRLTEKGKLEVVQGAEELPGDIGDALKMVASIPSGNRVGYSSQIKSLPDRVVADSKVLTDLVNTPSFLEKGLDGLDVPSKDAQLRRVLRLVQNDQIRNAVVRAIPVDVVDVLRSKQFSPEVLFHDVSVFRDLFAIDGDNTVALPVDVSSRLVAVIARAATEIANSSFGHQRVVPSDFYSAMVARDADLGGAASSGAKEGFVSGNSVIRNLELPLAGRAIDVRHKRTSLIDDDSIIAQADGKITSSIFSDADVSIKALYSKDGAIAGAYKDGKAWMVADQIKQGEAKDVFLHEAAHALLREDKIFMAKHKAIIADFERLHKAGSAPIKAAFARVPADTVADVRTEEALAYFVQSNPKHSLVQRIWSAIRAALFRLGMPIKNLTESDMIALFTQGAKAWARLGEAKEDAVVGVPALASRQGKSFASQLAKYAGGDLPGTAPLTVGETPEVLRLLGADALPVVINRSAVDKILHNKHGLPLDLLKQLPEQLADPIMIFDSAKEPDGLVVMTELQHDGKTVVAAVHLNKTQRHHEVNRIASVYGKDNDGIFGQWIRWGLLRYRNKRKSRPWFQSRGLQLPKEGTNNGLSGKKILSEDDLVKPLYSKRSIVDDIMEAAYSSATPEQVRRSVEEGPIFPGGFDIPEEGKFTKLWDRLVYKAQDKFNSLKKAQDQAKKARGLNELPEAEDAYLAELRYHGQAGARIEDFHEEHVEPLIEAMHNAGLTLEDVGLFLWARHAPEANAQLEKVNPDREDNAALSGMSNDDAAKVLAGFGDKLAALEGIGKRVDAITKMRRDLLVDSGLEKAETVAAWEKAYRHYVPLHREGMGGNLPSQGRGFDTRGKEKRRAGSTKDAVNILAHVVAQYEKTAIKAEKAKVGRAFLEFARNNPAPDLWEIDKVEYKPTFDRDGLVQYREEKGFILADNVLVVKVDGEDHRITFNMDNPHAERIVSAMKNLGADEIGTLTKTLLTVNHWLAAVNTAANPEFVLSNLARDLQTAGFNLNATEAKDLKKAIFKDVAKAWRGIRKAQQKDYSHTWARYFREFRQAGGKTGWLEHYKDITAREARLKKMLDEMGDGTLMKMKRGLKAMEQFIEHENTAVENAIRLSAFVHARKAGLSEARAAALAKELTVNFNRKGDAGQMLNALYLFYNASIQGTVRMFRAAKSPAVQKMMAGTVVAAAILDMMNRAIGGDDDDDVPFYDKVPDHVKERNLIVMRPGGDYFKIPLPWGYNTLHVTGQEIGKALDDSHQGYSPAKSALRVAGAVLSSFNPIGSEASILQMISPTITDPVVQWAENKDWAGRPLRPESSFDRDKPESSKYWGSVREPSRWVAEKLNELTGGDEVRSGAVDISPELFDLAIDTATGGAGRFLSDMVATPIKALKGEKVEAYTIPMARKVYGQQSDTSTRTMFYENLDSVRVVERQLKHYAGDSEKVAEIKEHHAAEMKMSGIAKLHEKEIAALRKRRKAIEKSSLTDDIKRARIEEIDERIMRVMRRFNKVYRERLLAEAA